MFTLFMVLIYAHLDEGLSKTVHEPIFETEESCYSALQEAYVKVDKLNENILYDRGYILLSRCIDNNLKTNF